MEDRWLQDYAPHFFLKPNAACSEHDLMENWNQFDANQPAQKLF
jgi:hypothetical protein